MALRPGTVPQFGGSLGQAIEGAFAAEMFALKGEDLPEFGRDERRALFAAIAQAVLSYLAANQSELVVSQGISGTGFPTRVDVRAPVITVAAGSLNVTVTGKFFPAGTVALAWELPHAPAGSATANSSGSFSASFSRAGRSGRQAISARNVAGDQAIGLVQL